MRFANLTGAGAGKATALLAVCAGLIAAPLSASAQQKLTWKFSEQVEASDDGARSARLVSMVPQTDYAQFSAVCESGKGKSPNIATITVAVEIGKLNDGDKVRVRFSGGGFEREIQGNVTGARVEVGITGAIVNAPLKSPVWSAMARLQEIDVTIPGYLATKLDLRSGRKELKKFLAACRSMAVDQDNNQISALTGDDGAAPTGGETSKTGPVETEREAFAKAREKGTIAGWQAFLSRFPTGFRADLARAYIKRLTASAGTSNESEVTSVAPSGLTTPKSGRSSPYEPGAKSEPAPAPPRRASVEPRRPSCTGGRYYSRARGRCVCPSSRPEFIGGRCRRVVRVEPEPRPRYRARRRCGRGQYFSERRGRCVCTPGRTWYRGRCRFRGYVKRYERRAPRRRYNGRRPGESGVCAQMRRRCEIGGSSKTCKQYRYFCGG